VLFLWCNKIPVIKFFLVGYDFILQLDELSRLSSVPTYFTSLPQLFLLLEKLMMTGRKAIKAIHIHIPKITYGVGCKLTGEDGGESG